MCPSLTPGARVRSLRSPLRALAPVFASGRRALAPSGPGAGGAGLGSLPSLSPAPGGRCRRSRRRGVAGSLVRWFLWGVLWPLLLSFLPLPPCCVPRGLVWLPGRVPPWAFRFAPRRWRCPVRWPFAGSRRPPPPPCSPPVAPLALSRGGASVRVRGGVARRLSRSARAGFGGRAVRRLPLARRRWRGVAPGALVRLARAGLRPARPRLARGRRPAPRPPALPRLAAARRVRACRACRCRFPRAAVFLAPLLVLFPLFLSTRVTFFSRLFLKFCLNF